MNTLKVVGTKMPCSQQIAFSSLSFCCAYSASQHFSASLMPYPAAIARTRFPAFATLTFVTLSMSNTLNTVSTPLPFSHAKIAGKVLVLDVPCSAMKNIFRLPFNSTAASALRGPSVMQTAVSGSSRLSFPSGKCA